MKNITKFSKFTKLNEDLESDLRDKLSEDYKSLKRNILKLVEDTVDEPEKLLNVQNYMNDYIEDENEEVVLEGFIENSDIYEFYLKNQADIDELLTDDEFFDKIPSDSNVFSLYDYMIEGTKEAVKSCIEKIYDDVFKVE